MEKYGFGGDFLFFGLLFNLIGDRWGFFRIAIELLVVFYSIFVYMRGEMSVERGKFLYMIVTVVLVIVVKAESSRAFFRRGKGEYSAVRYI